MTRRTVRDGLEDGPHDLGGRSEIATRTTSIAPRNTDSLSRVDTTRNLLLFDVLLRHIIWNLCHKSYFMTLS
jgi:hypothetical protein